jgi:hypothetical protein
MTRFHHHLGITCALSLLAVVLLTGTSGFANQELYPEVRPDPAYTPGEVVGIQMRALGNNNIPFENAGIALTFRFASPGNRVNTGPLQRFSKLFDNPAYQPMLDHRLLEIGESMIVNSSALVPVIIEDENGGRAGYMFTLSRQIQAPYENCWMTDKVVRIRLPSAGSAVF